MPEIEEKKKKDIQIVNEPVPGLGIDIKKPTKKESKDPFYITHFSILIIVIVIIILVPGYIFLVKDEYNEIDSHKEVFENQKNELETLTQGITRYNKLILDYKDINDQDREKLYSLLPEEADESSLYVNMAGIADSLGLKLNNVDVKIKTLATRRAGEKAQQVTQGLRKATISIDLKDVSYSKLKKLLNEIESNLRLLDVLNYSYNPDLSSVSMNIITYFLE